jgi:hypothetical protein
MSAQSKQASATVFAILSILGSACPRAFRCRLALIVRCALDAGEARLPISVAFRDRLALLEKRKNSSLSNLGGFRPGMTQISLTGGGHDRTAFRL